MELRNSVKTLNYVKKFLLRETDGILPYGHSAFVTKLTNPSISHRRPKSN